MRKEKMHDEEEILDEVDELDEGTEWAPNMVKMFGGRIPPAGCRACGGPYPSCMTSCSMFDD